MNSEKNLKEKKKKRSGIVYNFCYDFVKITGAIPTLLWMRPKILYPFGRPRMRGAMLVSANHRSFLDPVIVHCTFKGRRLHCLATKELYNTKIKERFFNLMHCIKTDKENFSLSAFHDVIERLQEGKVVVIFPEGQVNLGKEERPDGGLSPFKSGAALMAHKSGAPILPIYIVKREKWYQRQTVVVGKPIDVCAILGKMPSLEALTQVSEELRNMELELFVYYEANVLKKTQESVPAGEPEKEETKSEQTEEVYK